MRGLAERREARSLHGRGEKSDEKEEDGEEGKGEVNAKGHNGMGENSLYEGAAHRRLQEEAVGDSDADLENKGICKGGDRGHDRYLDDYNGNNIPKHEGYRCRPAQQGVATLWHWLCV